MGRKGTAKATIEATKRLLADGYKIVYTSTSGDGLLNEKVQSIVLTDKFLHRKIRDVQKATLDILIEQGAIETLELFEHKGDFTGRITRVMGQDSSREKNTLSPLHQFVIEELRKGAELCDHGNGHIRLIWGSATKGDYSSAVISSQMFHELRDYGFLTHVKTLNGMGEWLESSTVWECEYVSPGGYRRTVPLCAQHLEERQAEHLAIHRKYLTGPSEQSCIDCEFETVEDRLAPFLSE